MKSKIKEIGSFKHFIIFLAIIWGFTILSNFISDYSRPEVKIAKPLAMPLQITLKGDAEAISESCELIRLGETSYIEKVMVSEGSKFSKGDPLYKVSIDELTDELSSLKEQLAINNLDIDLNKQSIDYFEKISASDDIKKLKRDIENLKIEYENNKVFYDSGSLSMNDLKKSKDQYDSKLLELREKEMTLKKNKSSLNKDKLYFSQKNSEIYERIMSLEEIVKSEGIISAIDDGLITKLYVKVGDKVQKGDLFGISQGKGSDMIINLGIHKNKSKFLSIGDEIYMSSPKEGSKIKGILTSISTDEEDENKKNLTISFTSELILSGDKVSVNYQINTKPYNMVVPKNAIGSSSEGKFVYGVVKEARGFGDKYYTKKMLVEVGDEGDTEVVVLSGIGGDDYIITEVTNEKTLVDGKEIKIADYDGR